MRNALFTAQLYTVIGAHRAKCAIVNTKNVIIDHKSELACVGATAVVVGTAARVQGFRAGYEFATNTAQQVTA
jgi:hypothetical protein